MKHLIVFLFPAVLFLSCNQNSTTSETENGVPLTLEFTEENFTGNELIYEGDTLRAEMTFTFPVFSGGDEQVAKKINAYMSGLTQQDYFAEESESEESNKTLAQIAAQFFEDAKEATIAEYPYTGAWSYGFDTDTLMLDNEAKILTLIHNYSTYTGGAHPNYYIAMSTIDLNTGDTLTNEQLFEHDEILLKAANKRFIENEKSVLAESGYEFNMSDYWFENNHFRLPTAMGFTREGIRCIYSPYDVSSYARGAIDFVVPYSDVPHLKPKKKS